MRTRSQVFDEGNVVEVLKVAGMHSLHPGMQGHRIDGAAFGSCIFAASGPGGPTANLTFIGTPMKGIPTLRRKCGKTTNFHVTTLYHRTAHEAM